MKRLFVLLLMSSAFFGITPTVEAEEAFDVSRIVTVPGNVTETVFALGMGKNVVGICASSRYPEAVDSIPKVGYRTNLSAEGVLSLAPSIVIATDEAGPKDVLDQIRAAGVRVEIVAGARTFDGAVKRVSDVANVLGKQAQGREIVEKMRKNIAEAVKPLEAGVEKPKVLFVYVARNRSMVAGAETAAESMIALAGGVNAVTGFKEFKPINPEAIIEANPDFILLDHSGLESVGGIEGALKLPGVAQTTAGQKRQIVAMDKTLLLGFGPRLSEGAAELSRLIQK
jgi:iron complex transport system substrate-binding protein